MCYLNNGFLQYGISKDEKNPEIMIIDLESKAIKAENEARYLFLDKEYMKK